MATNRYVALLRGINVGGKNLVRMPLLRETFESLGFVDVATYLQSGNVVFATDRPAAGLEQEIEGHLASAIGLPVLVVVRSRAEIQAVVGDAPPGFGTRPSVFHSDVVFLKAPLGTAGAMAVVSLRDGVDQAWPGRDVVYFQRLSERRTQSRMSRMISTAEYRNMTIRNWNTTTAVSRLLDERASSD